MRTLLSGTKLVLESGRVITLASDVLVKDDWRDDNHFMGSLFNMDASNLGLYEEAMKDYEVDEVVDDVECHQVYERHYGPNAAVELTLVSSTPIKPPRDEPEEVEAEATKPEKVEVKKAKPIKVEVEKVKAKK